MSSNSTARALYRTFVPGTQYITLPYAFSQWKDGKRHGEGTLTLADGGKYVGQYKDSKKHGEGTYTYTDGAKYVGKYKDGKRHGLGKYTFANGEVDHDGEWENDEPKE